MRKILIVAAVFCVLGVPNSMGQAKAQSDDIMKDYIGDWVQPESPRSRIFRIRNNGDSFHVEVSNYVEEPLETKNVFFDGDSLSFTVKIYDTNPGWKRNTTYREGSSLVKVENDNQVEFYYYKLSPRHRELVGSKEWHKVFYLNGRVVGTEKWNYPISLKRK